MGSRTDDRFQNLQCTLVLTWYLGHVPCGSLQALVYITPLQQLMGSGLNFLCCTLMLTWHLGRVPSISPQALVYITPSQQLAQVMGSGLNFLFNIFNGYVIGKPRSTSEWGLVFKRLTTLTLQRWHSCARC